MAKLEDVGTTTVPWSAGAPAIQKSRDQEMQPWAPWVVPLESVSTYAAHFQPWGVSRSQTCKPKQERIQTNPFNARSTAQDSFMPWDKDHRRESCKPTDKAMPANGLETATTHREVKRRIIRHRCAAAVVWGAARRSEGARRERRGVAVVRIWRACAPGRTYPRARLSPSRAARAQAYREWQIGKQPSFKPTQTALQPQKFTGRSTAQDSFMGHGARDDAPTRLRSHAPAKPPRHGHCRAQTHAALRTRAGRSPLLPATASLCCASTMSFLALSVIACAPPALQTARGRLSRACRRRRWGRRRPLTRSPP